MAIGTMRFPMLTNEQANPFMTGFQQGIGNMQNIAQFPQLLKQRILENQIREAQARYAEPMAKGELEKLTQFNKMYIPNIQSEIGLRGAQAGHLGAETNQINQMLPLNLQEKQMQNALMQKYGQAETESKIKQALAQAQYYSQGGPALSAGGKDLRDFTNQLKMDNPQLPNENDNDYAHRINQMGSAYLSEGTTMPNGEPLPQLSGLANQYLNMVMNRNTPAAIKNQYTQADILEKELNKFPINTVSEFAGPKGRIKLLEARGKMFLNPNDPSIDPKARVVLSSLNSSILNMDQMRKALGTSIVPGYVYDTIGRLANPNDSIWLDPKQVIANYKVVTDWARDYKKELEAKVKHGVLASANTNVGTAIKNKENDPLGIR